MVVAPPLGNGAVAKRPRGPRVASRQRRPASSGPPRKEVSSNIALVEAVSLYVGGWAEAEAFYCDFLGFAVDPRSHVVGPGGVPDLLRVSMGLNQLRLPVVGRQGVACPQLVQGTLEVLYPPEEFARLEALVAEAAGLPGELAVRLVSSERIEVACPWGNVWRCVPTPEAARWSAWLRGLGVVPQCARLARGVGLSQIEVRCPVGKGLAIAQFYREYLGAPAECSSEGHVRVPCGGLTTLCFVESPHFREMRGVSRGVERDQWSVCLYLKEFDAVYARISEEGLEWDKMAATSFKSAGSGGSGGSMASAPDQFFFKDIRDVATGDVILELEHDVRSLAHPCCPLGRLEPLLPSGIMEAFARAEAEAARSGERRLYEPQPEAAWTGASSSRGRPLLEPEPVEPRRCGERRRASSAPPSETCARVCSLLRQPVALLTSALGRQQRREGALERGRSRGSSEDATPSSRQR